MSGEARKLTGCQNVHYSEVTITGGEASFGTPKRIPHLEEYNYSFLYAEASNYADNQQNIYRKKITGADFGLVLSDLKIQVEAELMGKSYKKGGAVTNTNDQQKTVALLWEETYSDGTSVRNVLYNTKISRDELSGKTEGENLEFTPVNLVGKAIPLPNGDIHYKMDSSDPTYDQTKFKAWFTAVQTPDSEDLEEMSLKEESKTVNTEKK